MTFNFSLTKTAVTAGVAILGLALSAGSTLAAALGNIDENTIPANFADSTGIDSDTTKAVSFTTGSDTYTLTGLRMWLSGTDDTDNIDLSIRTTETGNPNTGTVVTTFGSPDPVFGSGQAIYSLTPDAVAVLDANTDYYLYADIDSAFTYSWIIEDADPGTPGIQDKEPISDLGWTFGEYLFSNDAGATFNTSGLYNAFEIQAEVEQTMESTPEPGTMLGLLALGAFGGASALKNKNKG